MSQKIKEHENKYIHITKKKFFTFIFLVIFGFTTLPFSRHLVLEPKTFLEYTDTLGFVVLLIVVVTVAFYVFGAFDGMSDTDD